MRLWHETFGQAQSKWQLTGWLLAFAFPVFALVVDKAASTIYAIFFLAGLWLLIRGRYERPDPLLRWVLIAFAAYFVVGVLSFFLGEQTRLGEKLLGRDVRFFAAISVVIAVARIFFSYSALRLALNAGAVVTGVVALTEIALSSYSGYRASGETISILFGNLSAALAVVNLLFVLNSTSRRDRILSLLAAILSGIAALLSGTRGAWIAMTVVSVISICLWAKKNPYRLASAAGVTLILLMILALTPIKELISLRLTESFSGFSNYSYLRRDIEQRHWPATYPACINHRDLLEWMTGSGLAQGKRALSIDMLEDEGLSLVSEFRCPTSYFVRFTASADESGWVYLPERSAPPGKAGGGGLIARGNGVFRLVGNNGYEIRVTSDRWQRAILDGNASESRRHLIAVPAGSYVDVAPLLTVAGEYRYPAANTSIGSRIQMLKLAVEAFVSSPILGCGTGGYPVYIAGKATSGHAPWQLTRFDHAHNEILTVAAERGIIGLITLFGVYAAPFLLFWRRRDVFGWAGMAFVASIFISGLTETIFNHSLGITYYCMLVLLLATAPKEPAEGVERQQASNSENSL